MAHEFQDGCRGSSSLALTRLTLTHLVPLHFDMTHSVIIFVLNFRRNPRLPLTTSYFVKLFSQSFGMLYHTRNTQFGNGSFSCCDCVTFGRMHSSFCFQKQPPPCFRPTMQQCRLYYRWQRPVHQFLALPPFLCINIVL